MPGHGGHANEQAMALVCDIVYVSIVEAVVALDHQAVLRHYSSIH